MYSKTYWGNFNITLSVQCACINHLYTPARAHKLYRIITCSSDKSPSSGRRQYKGIRIGVSDLWLEHVIIVHNLRACVGIYKLLLGKFRFLLVPLLNTNNKFNFCNYFKSGLSH
jgi:hypothetical protein